MFTYVINEEIKLKLLDVRDVDIIFNAIEDNRIYLSEFSPWVNKINTLEDVKSFIESELKRFSENKGFYCGIFVADKFIGEIILHNIDWINKKTSIGYWIINNFQGKGIMTIVCKEITKYIFNELQLNKVEIRTRTENYKSQGIPERLGYRRDGILRSEECDNGSYYDHVVYSMLKSEWNS